MDDLKKTTEDARNSIRWLEQEFTKGSRFIRLQRNNETLSICLLKIPKKLGKFSSIIGDGFWDRFNELNLKIFY